MGQTCGGITSACCSNDVNVDINNQVEANRTANQKSFQHYSVNTTGETPKKSKNPIDVNMIEKLPKSNQERINAEKTVNLVIALVKGHLTRVQFKKIKFINRVTGKKAHQIVQKDLNLIPQSTMRVVLLKEQEFGPLRINSSQVREIEQNRSKLGLKNGYSLSEGQIYSGQWNDNTNTKEGYGLQVWPDGSKFEGFWFDDKAKGYGRFILADGDVYQGSWVGDKAHGEGEYFYAEGATYKGGWNEDKQEGKGKEEWPDGSFYHGEYLRGKKHGRGIFQWADGAKFDGDWKDNKMHGSGTFKWADGRVYQGEYVNDKKHGQGIYTWPDSRMYQGRFHNGKQHGKGSYRQTSGQEVYGIWEKGKKTKICKTYEEFQALEDNV